MSDYQTDLEESKRRIQYYNTEIAKILVKEGFAQKESDVSVRFGTEIEFTKVAGKEAYLKRLKEIIEQVESTGTINMDDKAEAYMPEKARTKQMDKKFETRIGKSPRSGVAAEPQALQGASWYRKILVDEEGKKVHSPEPEFHAFSQGELTSAPHSPLGMPAWICRVEQLLIDTAKDFDLARITMKSKPNTEVLSNSVHINSTVMIRDGADKYINLFQRNNFPEECKGKTDVPDRKMSQLGLSIAYARNAFVKEGFLMYAPITDCIQRFSHKELAGPNHLGFFKRRESGNYGGVGIRGAGRVFSRANDPNPTNDAGPLRLEERSVCLEALGHPNKEAYPSQKNMTYELFEAQMYIIFNGLRFWQQRMESARNGEYVKPLKEKDLYRDKMPVELDIEKWRNDFKKSSIVFDAFGDRVHNMVHRYDETAALIEADFGPDVKERGHHVERVIGLSGAVKRDLER